MTALVEQNVRLIADSLTLIENLDGSGYAIAGPHFRHCIDFYECFLRGLESGHIDYDERDRSTEVEQSPAAAAAALEGIRERLEVISDSVLTTPVEMRADVVDPGVDWSRSTVGRELVFLVSHTVHHHALIALLLRQKNIEVPADFGMAPSTLEHQRR